jgi:hypothetical protein
LAELGNHLGGEPAGKWLLLRVAAEILEWEHGDHEAIPTGFLMQRNELPSEPSSEGDEDNEDSKRNGDGPLHGFDRVAEHFLGPRPRSGRWRFTFGRCLFERRGGRRLRGYFGVVGGFIGFLIEARAAIFPPRVDFGTVGVNGAELVVEVAVNGQAFLLLPALDGANVAAEIGGNLLPGLEKIAG